MKEIKFKFKDEMSKGEWIERSCICRSVEECIKFYGLGVDCDYVILEVKDLN